MNHYLIECCANSIQSAINGEKGGANRIELCTDLELGGVTPQRKDILKTKKVLNIPICVLIRPRGGNFVYSQNELSKILSDIQFCKTIGCEGVVIGALKKNGSINMKQTEQMVRAATPMRVTFHRAFDEGNDLLKNLEEVIVCGCDTLLTAGQSENVNSGISNLEQLVKLAKWRVTILAGSGVNHTNAEALYKIGIKKFHLSGSMKNLKGKLEVCPLLIKKMKDKLEQIV
jgi:copper homeostasis protein